MKNNLKLISSNSKTMKNILTIFIFFPFLISAQSISLDYGKASTSFIFKNTEGIKTENLVPEINDCISLNYIILKKPFTPVIGISFNEYSTRAELDDVSWNMSYLGLNLGGHYYYNLNVSDLLKDSVESKNQNEGLKILFNTNIKHRVLLNGSQRVENSVYNLREFNNGSFTNLFLLSIGTGILYDLNSNAAISLNYSFDRGINNLEEEGQSLYVSSHNIYLGIKLTLEK